jgi:hypothetical protein
MSVVCVLTPVVIAGWPAFSAAVTAAAVSLGYTVVDHSAERAHNPPEPLQTRKVQLEIEQSEIVTTQLARYQRLSITKNGVIVTFSRDARGKASLCVEGVGHSEGRLRELGEEIGGRVVQQYVYQRLLDEMRKRDFIVVEEEVSEDASVRLKVRRWDN